MESIQFASIPGEIITLLNRQNEVTKNLAKYMCTVLRLNGEFDYTSRNIRFGTIPYSELSTSNIYGSVAYVSPSGSTVYYRVNNNVQKGDVIQICEMPDEYMSMFNPQGFSISVSNSSIATVSNGVVKVAGDSGSFDIIYSYDGAECYRVTFNIVKKFSGGMGIEKAPYLISTPSDFSSIRAAQEQCHYLLINDINYEGARLPVLDLWKSMEGFGGILDGGGYKVYNYEIVVTSDSVHPDSEYEIALFPIVQFGAVIKNLTIGNSNCHSLDGYSVQHRCDFGIIDHTYYHGILSGINNGIISNCQIQNVNIDDTIEVYFNFQTYGACVGGFAACNGSNGIITHSTISDSSFVGWYKPRELCVGGLAGISRGSISNCFSLSNNISAEVYGNYGYSRVDMFGGNIVGKDEGSCRECYGENSAVIMDTNSKMYPPQYGVHKSTMPAANDSNTMKNNGWIDRGDGIAVADHDIAKKVSGFITPHKTVYYVGDELNLTGLELYYENAITTTLLGASNRVNAYDFEVSGFNPNLAGTQTVTLTYNDLSTSFDVTVLCAHQWGSGTETLKPTHAENGIYTETCSVCGEAKETAIDKLLEHDYSEWDYYDPEQHQKVCSCGDSVKEAHGWDEGVETTKPTHTTAGELTKTCEDCGATIVEAIDPTAEHPFGDWANHDDAQHMRTCICGETEYGDHAWDDGVETLKPTFTTPGQMTRTCSDCGATKVESIDPMPGDLSCDGKITALDCAILNAYVQGTIEPTDIEIENYDFTGDGTIDDDDVKYLLDAILSRRS